MHRSNISESPYYAQFENSMHESLQKFGELCNSKQTKQSTVILLLNKHESFMDCIQKVSLGVCFTKKCGWNHEQWNGPDYQYADMDNKETDSDYDNLDDEIDDKKTNDDDDDDEKFDDNICSSSDILSYFPKHNPIVQRALNEMSHDPMFIKCYKYSLSFIIRQYIQFAKRFEPSLIDKSNSANDCVHNRQMYFHVIDAMDSENVHSMFNTNYGQIEWQHERLLWIGYYKNKDNDKCCINYLPKDILLMIMEYLKSPFSIFKCIKRDQLIKCGEL